MHKLLLSISAGLVAAVVMAFAVTPAQAGTPDVYDWRGPYAGIQLGMALGQGDFVDDTYNGGFPPFFPTVHWDADFYAPMGGVMGGYNWQKGQIVFGLEGEAGYFAPQGSALQPGVDGLGDPYDLHARFAKGWYGGVGMRLGYTVGPRLFYARAGGVYSAADVVANDNCIIAPCGTGIIKMSANLGWGYQLGAGVEQALTDKWTLRGEYGYTDFGSQKLRAVAQGGGFGGHAYTVNQEVSMHALTVALSYRF